MVERGGDSFFQGQTCRSEQTRAVINYGAAGHPFARIELRAGTRA